MNHDDTIHVCSTIKHPYSLWNQNYPSLPSLFFLSSIPSTLQKKRPYKRFLDPLLLLW